jgi:putative NADH-flavin reductase
MKILLTGSSGYIGSFLYAKLNEFHTVIRGVRHSVELEGDSEKVINFKSGQGLYDACKDVDCVIHCAYDSLDHFSNVSAIKMLLSTLSNTKVSKLILFGSFATYENSDLQSFNENTKTSKWKFKYLLVKNKIELLISEYLKTAKADLEVVYLQPTIVTDGQGGWEKFRRNLHAFDKIFLPYGGAGIFNSINREELSIAIIKSLEIKRTYFSEARHGYIKCLISGSKVKSWKEWLAEDPKLDAKKILTSNSNQLSEFYSKDLLYSLYYGGVASLLNGREFNRQHKLVNSYLPTGLDRVTLRCTNVVNIDYARYLGLL